MTTEALDFYAYWNGAQVADLWTTLALITGTDDYRSLLLCVALFGLICAAAGAAVRYRGGDLIVWIAAMVFIFSAAFVPRGVSGFLCLGRLFQGQPNEAAFCFL